MKKTGLYILIVSLLLGCGGCGGHRAEKAAGTLPAVTAPVTRETASSVMTEPPLPVTEPSLPVTEPSLPVTEPSSGEVPVSQETATEEPETEESTAREPVTEESATEEPVTEVPSTEESTTEEAATKEPTEEPAWEPVTEEPTAWEPATEEPTTEEPTTEEPTWEPVTEEPTAWEPVTEEATLPEPATPEEPAPREGILVCLDPGHQARANDDLEPQAPGSDILKPKVSDGTRGVTTGIRESVVNLTIALKLRDELEGRGYRVIMTRTSEDVDISNRERAILANEAGAQAFLRLHCDGSTDPSWKGSAIYCQHPYSEFNGFQYENSRRLSELLLGEICRLTGSYNRGVTEAYHYTGINWSQVPGGLIEMGFLTNAEEEQKLLDPAYQQLLAEAMANGLDLYFGR